jgi:hypothetical protein
LGLAQSLLPFIQPFNMSRARCSAIAARRFCFTASDRRRRTAHQDESEQPQKCNQYANCISQEHPRGNPLSRVSTAVPEDYVRMNGRPPSSLAAVDRLEPAPGAVVQSADRGPGQSASGRSISTREALDRTNMTRLDKTPQIIQSRTQFVQPALFSLSHITVGAPSGPQRLGFRNFCGRVEFPAQMVYLCPIALLG